MLFENIPVGNWKIEIKAYGPDDQIKYFGFTEAMINDGVITNVYLTLQPVATGVGSVLISVSWGSTHGVSGLAHWWTGDGTAHDQQGTSHGLLQNGASFAPGIIGQAFAFDGYNDVVTVSNPNLNFDTSNFSISVWVKANAYTEYCTIISKREETGNWQGWWLGRTLELGGVWRFEYGQVGNTANVYSDVHAVTGVFVHITVVVNRTEHIAQLYINGSLQPNHLGQSSTKTVGSVHSNDPLRIGRGALNSNTGNYVPWNGLIDHVKLFNKALTKEEVLQNYYSAN
ncbi:MAG: LamG domain-containing protein [Bacteroidota bacterium]